MKKVLKKPSDYPQFYFRLKSEEKDEIEKLIDKLVKRAEKNRKEGEPQRRRNHIITDALLIGLKELVKNGK